MELISQVPALAPRPVDGNKGSFGKIAIVAGSRGMSGAAALCASAALRGGAGLVRVAGPGEVMPIVAGVNPCYLTVHLPQDDHGRISLQAEPVLLELAKGNDVLAAGPGLGQSNDVSELISSLIRNTRIPLILDADALNSLQGRADVLNDRPDPMILTPHPGEFARLVNLDIPAVQAQRQELALRFAAEHQIVLVLKGHKTIVTDGRRIYINHTGNPGMATGGTGDVLTGLIAALLGQQLDPLSASILGVHLHGLAGDLVRDDLGEASLIASDLLEYLPQAFRTHHG